MAWLSSNREAGWFSQTGACLELLGEQQGTLQSVGSQQVMNTRRHRCTLGVWAPVGTEPFGANGLRGWGVEWFSVDAPATGGLCTGYRRSDTAM